MHTEFWKSLRDDFMRLRAECAIKPPAVDHLRGRFRQANKRAGRLTAIWTAQPAPGEWQLSYWNGKDGYGVTKRFEWHAQSAAARLGFGETGQKAVWFWLDRVRRDAPDSHLRPHLIEGSDGDGQLFSVEVLDICGLSAEYCIKCEADEMVALRAQARAPSEETPAPPELPAARSLVPDAALDRDGHSTDQVVEAPFFQYRYPEGFPDADQNAIENVRLEANRKISSNPVPSYDELSAARYAWVWELVSGAAPIFGRAAEAQHWSANRRRDTLRHFVSRAAGAAHLSRPALNRLYNSPEWKTLDDALFPADSPNTADYPTRNSSTLVESRSQPKSRGKRGRPSTISDELKEGALAVKGGKARAQILYQTRYPTPQQIKNVPSILKHFRRKSQSNAE
jgi:hypothetical protein